MRRNQPVIEFLCSREDRDVIAEPVPAKTVLPAWFRKLPGIDPAQLTATNNGMTVKRCMPFVDALSVGWIIPLAATVRLDVSDQGRTVTAGWEFDREMVSNHATYQIAGNPFEPHPPMKFHNFWTIRTMPGWSTLFVPPINRPDDVIQVFSGVVDTDNYTSRVNFPFVVTAPDGVYTLAKGRPLVQAIPFRRADAATRGEIRVETGQEGDMRERIRRGTLADDGWYRRRARGLR
jgi:hypothetical protein